MKKISLDLFNTTAISAQKTKKIKKPNKTLSYAFSKIFMRFVAYRVQHIFRRSP